LVTILQVFSSDVPWLIKHFPLTSRNCINDVIKLEIDAVKIILLKSLVVWKSK